MKIAFCSDIHLNFLSSSVCVAFAMKLNESDADAIIITGDIAEAPSLPIVMEELQKNINKPIYYIHGNHDFYRGSFDSTYNASRMLTQKFDNLFWLQEAGIIKLTPSTCLVGHDGWYDCRYGQYIGGKSFKLADFYLIQDLNGLNLDERLVVFKHLGDNAAIHLRKVLPQALSCYDNVIYATHVPPFTQASLFQDKPSELHALPYFSCKVIGETLVEIGDKYPDKNITVLCGHTHNRALFTIGNINVICAGARYYHPDIYSIIEIH